MPDHICPRCNYKTDRRSSFRIHINRKDICEAIVEDVELEDIRLEYNNNTAEKIVHICDQCNKHFTSKHNLVYHLKVCKNKPTLPEVIENMTTQHEELVNTLRNKDIIIAELTNKEQCLHSETNAIIIEKDKIIKTLLASLKEVISSEYIYLLQLRESVQLKENVFKLGRTCQMNSKRFNQYPKGSILLLQIACTNSVQLESDIKAMFAQKYIPWKAYGTEYFKGDHCEMIADICNMICNK
jgi:hypothetical protein